MPGGGAMSSAPGGDIAEPRAANSPSSRRHARDVAMVRDVRGRGSRAPHTILPAVSMGLPAGGRPAQMGSTPLAKVKTSDGLAMLKKVKAGAPSDVAPALHRRMQLQEDKWHLIQENRLGGWDVMASAAPHHSLGRMQRAVETVVAQHVAASAFVSAEDDTGEQRAHTHRRWMLLQGRIPGPDEVECTGHWHEYTPGAGDGCWLMLHDASSHDDGHATGSSNPTGALLGQSTPDLHHQLKRVLRELDEDTSDDPGLTKGHRAHRRLGRVLREVVALHMAMGGFVAAAVEKAAAAEKAAQRRALIEEPAARGAGEPGAEPEGVPNEDEGGVASAPASQEAGLPGDTAEHGHVHAHRRLGEALREVVALHMAVGGFVAAGAEKAAEEIVSRRRRALVDEEGLPGDTAEHGHVHAHRRLGEALRKVVELHMAVQRMRRGHSRESYLELVQRFREPKPNKTRSHTRLHTVRMGSHCSQRSQPRARAALPRASLGNPACFVSSVLPLVCTLPPVLHRRGGAGGGLLHGHHRRLLRRDGGRPRADAAHDRGRGLRAGRVRGRMRGVALLCP